MFYAQSGGVTAVINASACGVIETARKHKNKLGKVYAGRNGILGALTEDMIDTTAESAQTIAALRHTPGGAFGSARYKLKGLDKNRAEYERLIEVFKAHDIGYFFYNGGGDSMDTAHKVSQLGAELGYPVVCIGVPKTVDNDLPITDTCPGFGSVAKYVAVSTREAALDVASMARTSTRVFVLEVMGRHAGWIAAAGGLAGERTGRRAAHDPVPRDPVRRSRVPRAREGMRRRSTSIASSSCPRARATPTAGSSPRPAARTRSATRSSAASRPIDRAARQGEARLQVPLRDRRLSAARRAPHRVEGRRRAGLCGGQGRRGARARGRERRDADDRAQVRASRTDGRSAAFRSPKVANKEKMMPRNFISKDGFAITAACRTLSGPLIRGEDYPPYKNGLPSYVSLRNQRVARAAQE